MAGRRGPQRGRRRRVPTWMLLTAVAAMLGTSVALFAVGTFADDDTPSSPETAAPAKDRADSTLSVPEETEAPTDARRRASVGRTRLDPDEVTTPVDGDGVTSTDDAASSRPLDGIIVAVAPASSLATTRGPAARSRTIGGVVTRCSPATAPTQAQLDADREAVARLASRLATAGARVIQADERIQDAPCPLERRIRAFSAADVALVVHAADSGRAAIAAAIVGASSTDADAASAAALRADLERFVDRATVARKTLVASGAIDLPGGPVVAYVTTGPEASDAGMDAFDALVEGLAAVATTLYPPGSSAD